MKALGGFEGNGAAQNKGGGDGEKDGGTARQQAGAATQGGADGRQTEQTDDGARANMLAAIIERHERISNNIKRRR